MPEHTTTQCVLFPGIFARPVIAKFDQSQGSSDGGAVLLKAADRELGLITALRASADARRAELQPTWVYFRCCNKLAHSGDAGRLA